MGNFYRPGDVAKCNTFGSVKPFLATVTEVTADGQPVYFRDRNNTLVTPADVVSFSHSTSTSMYRAKCVIIAGIIGPGNWRPEDKVFRFKAESGLTDAEIETKARGVMYKRWKTARFVCVLP